MTINLNIESCAAPTQRVSFSVNTKEISVDFIDEALSTAKKTVKNLINRHQDFWLSVSTEKHETDGIYCSRYRLGVTLRQDGKWSLCENESPVPDDVTVCFQSAGVVDEAQVESFIEKRIIDHIR